MSNSDRVTISYSRWIKVIQLLANGDVDDALTYLGKAHEEEGDNDLGAEAAKAREMNRQTRFDTQQKILDFLSRGMIQEAFEDLEAEYDRIHDTHLKLEAQKFRRLFHGEKP